MSPGIASSVGDYTPAGIAPRHESPVKGDFMAKTLEVGGQILALPIESQPNQSR